jgi:anti-sigma B factor antagonist
LPAVTVVEAATGQRPGSGSPPGITKDVIEHSEPRFEADERLVNGVPVVGLAGELDYGTVAAIEQRVQRLMGRGHDVLVVDLTRATLLTSSVINVLFAAARRLRLADGGLAIACADPNICKVIELTSLDQAAPVHATVDEAIGALRRFPGGLGEGH